jgi:hypothetical protein
MSERLNKEATQEQQPKNKHVLTRMKESLDTPEERLEVLSTFVRLGILVWSGAILTLAYVKPPAALQIPEQKFDPTFIASVFTGVLATFGVQTEMSKEDMDRLIAAAARKNEKPGA